MKKILRKANKGFTLAELLIVVAIIAVLVAISIPIFSSQLEKSREAADLANVRSAYAEVMAAAITEDKAACYSVNGDAIYSEADNKYTITVNLKQKKEGWDIDSSELTIGGVNHDRDMDITWIGDPAGEGGTCEVIYNPEDEVLILKWDGTAVKTLLSGGLFAGSNAGSTAVTITGLAEPLSRLCSGWGADKTTGLMSISGAIDAESGSRVTLTTTPIALANGAQVEITAADGYQNGYFLMKYDAEKGGFVKVVDSGWKAGTVSFTVDGDGYYLVTNTKKVSGNLTVAEAEANATLKISGNEDVYSTAGMTGTTFNKLNNVDLKTATALTNSTTSKTGGTVTEGYGYYRGAAYFSASGGQILSLKGSDDYKYAYFFLKNDGSKVVLFDSGWLNYGDSTAIEVPQDCQLAIQVQSKNIKMSEETLSKALNNVTIYSK